MNEAGRAISADPPALRIDHRCRISVLESERLWSLRGDTLWAGSPQGEIAIPLKEISMVRLMYAPTRMQLQRYRCLLYSHGMCRGTIQNEHYVKFATFEDRSDTYRAMVTALIYRLEGVQPACRIIAGATIASYLLQCAILVVSAIGLGLLLMFMWSAVGWLVIVKLLIVAFFVPAAIAWVRKNKPRKLPAGSVPPELLPAMPKPPSAS